MVNNKKKQSSSISKRQGTFSAKDGVFKPPQDPIAVSLQPWNHIYLYKSFAGENTFAVKDIISILVSQTSESDTKPMFAQNARLFLRIHSVMIWNIIGKAIALTPYDLTSNGADELGGFFDCGGQPAYPRLGYKWPPSCRDKIIDAYVDKDRKVFSTLVGSGDTSIAYIKVTWKSAGPARFSQLPPEILTHIQDDVHSIRTVNGHILDTMRSQSPGLVSRTIDGVTKAAEVVAVAGLAASDFQSLQQQVANLSSELKLIRLSFRPAVSSECSEAEDLGRDVHYD